MIRNLILVIASALFCQSTLAEVAPVANDAVSGASASLDELTTYLTIGLLIAGGYFTIVRPNGLMISAVTGSFIILVNLPDLIDVLNNNAVEDIVTVATEVESTNDSTSKKGMAAIFVMGMFALVLTFFEYKERRSSRVRTHDSLTSYMESVATLTESRAAREVGHDVNDHIERPDPLLVNNVTVQTGSSIKMHSGHTVRNINLDD